MLYRFTFACCKVCSCCFFLSACFFVCAESYYHCSASLRFFLCIFTYLRSYELEFCSIILLQFSIFLDTDIFWYNLELFICFVLLFIHLLVNTCIITYIFLQFVTLIICNISFLFVLLFLSLHVDHAVTNASFFLCLSLNMYMQLLKYLNIDIFTIYFYNFLLYLQFYISEISVKIIYCYLSVLHYYSFSCS